MRKTDDELIVNMLKEGKLQKEIAEYFGVSPAAICRRVKRLLPPPKSLENLTEKEQKFAIQVASGKTQTQAALASFEVSSMESAKVMGSQLMAKPEIQMAVSELMDYHGMSRSYRVQKLKTHVDNRDPNVSLKALDQSWRLDSSYTEERPIVVIHYHDVTGEIADLEKELAKLEGRVVEAEVVETPAEESTNNGD